jgi:hypothetical protein
MTIRREDLAAAAALGLLQYRQIDPLLVFLLQRDVREKRQMLSARVEAPGRGWFRSFLFTCAVLLAIVTAAMFGMLFWTRAQPVSIGLLLTFAGMYLMAAFGAVNWIGQHNAGGTTQTLSALAVASVPLAVFTLAQFA